MSCWQLCCTSNYLLTYSYCKDGTIVCLTDSWPYILMSLWEGMGVKPSLTSKLLFPVAGDLAALGLYGLLAVDSCACSFPGARSTVPFIGHTHAPLPIPTVRLALLLPWTTKQTPLATLKETSTVHCKGTPNTGARIRTGQVYGCEWFVYHQKFIYQYSSCAAMQQIQQLRI